MTTAPPDLLANADADASADQHSSASPLEGQAELAGQQVSADAAGQDCPPHRCPPRSMSRKNPNPNGEMQRIDRFRRSVVETQDDMLLGVINAMVMDRCPPQPRRAGSHIRRKGGTSSASVRRRRSRPPRGGGRLRRYFRLTPHAFLDFPFHFTSPFFANPCYRYMSSQHTFR